MSNLRGLKKCARRVNTIRKWKAWNVDKMRKVEHKRQSDFGISNLVNKVKNSTGRTEKGLFRHSLLLWNVQFPYIVQRPSHCSLPCVNTIRVYILFLKVSLGIVFRCTLSCCMVSNLEGFLLKLCSPSLSSAFYQSR